MKYRVLVDFEVIQLMDRLQPASRRLLENRFLQLQDFSTRFVDYHEHDQSGRRIEISLVGRFAIKLWIDHLDRHIKVLEVTLADRAS
jgi:hypothetical protein